MPPKTVERRMGFTALPLRCPSCDRRLKLAPCVMYGGVLRCGGCKQLQYVLVLSATRLAFTADVTANEVHQMFTKGLPALEVLRRLGAIREAA